jgi:post-segregation antitoxin (ccd killing protein)
MLVSMAGTSRITVTLPSDQVEELKRITDNVSGYVADAVARQIRHELLAEELRRHQIEHGEFTESERAAARAAILDAIDGQSNAA